MKCFYVATFAAQGLALPENEPDVHFLDPTDTGTSAVLTRTPDEKLFIVDRALALKKLLLTAIFHASNPTSIDEKLAKAIHQIRTDRTRVTGSVPTLIVTVTLNGTIGEAAKH